MPHGFKQVSTAILTVFLIGIRTTSLAQPFSKGDVDGDERFTLDDIESAIDISLGTAQGDERTVFAADFNGDGTVNVLDVTAMLDALDKKPLSSHVELPPGSVLDLQSLTITSGFNELVPAADGSLSIPRPEVPCLSMVANSNGNAMLLSVDSPYGSDNELSAQSTAETLVYFTSYLFTAPSDLYEEIRRLLRRTPAVSDLARVIEGKLAVDENALVKDDVEIQAAVVEAVRAPASNHSPTSPIHIGISTPENHGF